MEHSWRHIDTDQIGMQMALGYRIISSLKAEVNFSYNVSHTDDDTYYGEETSRMLAMRCIVKRALPNSALEIGDQNAAAATSVAGGELKLSNTKNESYSLRGTLTYNKSLTENQSITANLIGELSHSKYSGFGITKRNYLPDRGMIFDNWDIKKYTSFTDGRIRMRHEVVWRENPDSSGGIDFQCFVGLEEYLYIEREHSCGLVE